MASGTDDTIIPAGTADSGIMPAAATTETSFSNHDVRIFSRFVPFFNWLGWKGKGKGKREEEGRGHAVSQ
jgi:hypothetical protein